VPRDAIAALLAAALLAASGPCLSQASAPEPQYRLKHSRVSTGSSIRSYGYESTSLPLNLTYAQLALADRRRFHAHYEAIVEGDEPPFPLEGLQALLGPILKAQERWATRGQLTLVATIDEHGVAQQVQAIGEANPAMVSFASQVILVTKFKPAVCAGQTCRMDFPLRVRFSVK
jgi:hypothetical protein